MITSNSFEITEDLKSMVMNYQIYLKSHLKTDKNEALPSFYLYLDDSFNKFGIL